MSTFSKYSPAALVLSNCAIFISNLRSSVCSAVHVDAFCDKNNEPAYGCPEIVSPVIKSGSPILDMKHS